MTPDTFLAAFFGPGNRTQLDRLPTGQRDWLEPWLERARRRSYPVFLPRYTSDNRLLWYAVAATSPDGPALAELIRAFLGPTYSTFTGLLAALSVDDPVERAVHEYLGDTVYLITIPATVDPRDVRTVLDTMRQLLDRRPSASTRLPRPTGRIIRDLEYALSSGNDSLAQELLDTLRANGHLSTENLAFLEVLRRAATRDWDGLLTDNDIADMLDMRRPIRVTAALIEAVYQTHLLEWETATDVASATAAMRELLPRYRTLYRGLTGLQSASSIKSHILAALADGDWPNSVLTELLHAAGDLADEYGHALTTALQSLSLSQVPAREATERTPGIAELILRGQTQAAFDLLLPALPSVERSIWLLQCAYDLDTLSHAQSALHAFLALSHDDQQGVRLRRWVLPWLRHAEEMVGRGEAPQVPADWREWFALVATGAVVPGTADAWASRGSEEWSTSDLSSSMSAIVEHLDQATGAATEAYVRGLPHLLRALAHTGEEVAHHREFHMAVLSMLTTYGDLSPAIRDVLLDEADLLLEGADAAAYRSIVDDLRSAWSQVKAPSTLNWALQALDLLAVHPCRDIGTRTAFVAATIATAAAHRHRLSPEQAITLDEVATELGVPSGLRPKMESGGEVQDPLASLAGQRVTLYTLTEPAAIRVRDVLTSYGARVQVRSDHVATPGLRDAVREADIVVMVTRSAAHQATDYIRSACPPASLVVAQGKGSSSILCALRQRFAVESHVAA